MLSKDPVLYPLLDIRYCVLYDIFTNPIIDLILYPLLDIRCTEDGAFFILLRALIRTRYISIGSGGCRVETLSHLLGTECLVSID